MSKSHKKTRNGLEKDIVFHLFTKHAPIAKCEICKFLKIRLEQLQEQGGIIEH